MIIVDGEQQEKNKKKKTGRTNDYTLFIYIYYCITEWTQKIMNYNKSFFSPFFM